MDKNQIAKLILDSLEKHRDSIVEQWANPIGTHTHHFYIDNFLPHDLVHEIYQAFPQDADGFHNRESFRERKRTLTDLSKESPILTAITYAFQDPAVVEKLSEILGLEHIEPDPSLYASGLSMMFKDNFLNPHIDNSHNADRTKYRRLNLLFYVTPDWKLENGGNFELWEASRKNQKTITSAFNRFVVMETNKTSWHSVSPVVFDGVRCCVSNYYFSEESPDGTDYFHVTSFMGRPEETLKSVIGVADNALRNTVSKVLKIGRGKSLINDGEINKNR